MDTNPTDRACAACGISGQPLAVTRSRGIGDQDWQEVWRCADITACHDRLFPELSRLIGDHAGEVATGRWLSPAGLDTLRQALADAVTHRDPSGACPDCEAHPAALCEDHAADLDRADSYRALARDLGIEVAS